MNNLFFEISLIAVLSFIGYGTTALIIPKEFKKNYIWFSPWIGTVLIILISVTSSLAKVSGSRSFYIVLIISSLTLIYAFILKRTKGFISQFNAIIVALLLVGLLFSTYYINDANMTYKIEQGKYFAKFSLIEKLMEGNSLDINDSNLGSSMIISFLLNLYKDQREIFLDNLPSIYFILSFPLLLIFIQSIYKKYEIFVTLLIYLIWLLLMKVLIIDLDTALYIGIVLMVLIFLKSYFLKLLKNNKISNNLEVYDIALALSLCSLTIILPSFFKVTMIVFTSVCIFCFFLAKHKINIFFALLKIGLILLLINPVMTGIALGFR